MPFSKGQRAGRRSRPNVGKRERSDRNSLHLVAAKGDIVTIKKLLKEGVNVNIQDENGKTALMVAVECHQTETVDALLDNGADSYITDNNGNTALYLAVDSFQLHLVPSILKRRVNNNIRAEESCSLARQAGQQFSYRPIVDSSEMPIPRMFGVTRGALKKHINMPVKDYADNLDSLEERINNITLDDANPEIYDCQETTKRNRKSKPEFGSKAPESCRTPDAFKTEEEVALSSEIEQADSVEEQIDVIINKSFVSIKREPQLATKRTRESKLKGSAKPCLKSAVDSCETSGVKTVTVDDKSELSSEEKEQINSITDRMNDVLETMKMSTSHIEKMKGNFERSQQIVNEWHLIREHLKSLIEERDKLTNENKEYRSIILRLRQNVGLTPSLGEVIIRKDYGGDRPQERHVVKSSSFSKLDVTKAKRCDKPVDSESLRTKELKRVSAQLSSYLKECRQLLEKQNSFHALEKKHLQEEYSKIDNDMAILQTRMNELKETKANLERKMRQMRKVDNELKIAYNKVNTLQNSVSSTVIKLCDVSHQYHRLPL